MKTFGLQEFKSSNLKSYTAVKDLSVLSVNEIKSLIFESVSTIRYMTKTKFITDKSINQYILNDKIVFIKEEEDANTYSLVLVHSYMNETQMLNMINSDIKRFNSIMVDYFSNAEIDK